MVGIVRGDDMWERLFEGQADDRYARVPVHTSRAQWSAWRSQVGDPFIDEGWDLIVHSGTDTTVAIRLERADGGGRFRTDAKALAYVKRRAAEGSELHQHALSLVGVTY